MDRHSINLACCMRRRTQKFAPVAQTAGNRQLGSSSRRFGDASTAEADTETSRASGPIERRAVQATLVTRRSPLR